MISWFKLSRRCAVILAVGGFAGLAFGASVPTSALAAEPPKFAGFSGDFSPIDPPLQMPQAGFEDKLGDKLFLKDFQGKVVILNFWATWCGPCVVEMPTLDRLQAKLGGKDLAVVAVALDREGIKKAAPFYRQTGVANLTLYTDRRSQLFEELDGKNLPTTFIINRDGKVVGKLVGAAAWDSDAAISLIRHYMDNKAS
jgi:thiol-disulfide isomerase/thioredoxin